MACKQGYWVRLAEAQAVDLLGAFPETSVISLATGWNLIAPVAPIDGLHTRPELLNCWGFGPLPLYWINWPAVLEPGLGYWIKTTQSVTVP